MKDATHVARTEPPAGLRGLSLTDTWGLLWHVVLPVFFQGILLKRRSVLRRAERRAWDRGAIKFLQALRRRYGEGPLLVRTPWRLYALVLSRPDVTRILEQTPHPFSPASDEKHAALSHFEPDNSLISRGALRTNRRDFHDRILDSNSVRHRLTGTFLSTAREEVSRLLLSLPDGHRLGWAEFNAAWYAGVRRIVFGNAARDAHQLTDLLYRLRSRSNWVIFRSLDAGIRARYQKQLDDCLSNSEPDSLAGSIRSVPTSSDLQIGDQVTQWLFAFDAGGITVFRALALAKMLGLQPTNEVYARALFLDTLRLWPTTPVILRQATGPIHWPGGTLPGGTGVIVFAPFFHRDDERLAHANTLDCAPWLKKDPAAVYPFLSFSSGPASCPGRHLVTLIGTAWLSALLPERLELLAPRCLARGNQLPGTFDYFSILFRLGQRTGQSE